MNAKKQNTTVHGIDASSRNIGDTNNTNSITNIGKNIHVDNCAPVYGPSNPLILRPGTATIVESILLLSDILSLVVVVLLLDFTDFFLLRLGMKNNRPKYKLIIGLLANNVMHF